MESHTISIRTHLDLTSKDANVLLHKGRTLFGLLQLTPDADKFLEFNPDLMEVIEKW